MIDGAATPSGVGSFLSVFRGCRPTASPPANRSYPSGMMKPCSRWDSGRCSSRGNSRWSVIRGPFGALFQKICTHRNQHPPPGTFAPPPRPVRISRISNPRILKALLIAARRLLRKQVLGHARQFQSSEGSSYRCKSRSPPPVARLRSFNRPKALIIAARAPLFERVFSRLCGHESGNLLQNCRTWAVALLSDSLNCGGLH